MDMARAESDPFGTRLLFLRITWMESYRGLADDSTFGGGDFVTQQGYGEEVFNFLPFFDRVYGYVRPPRGRGSRQSATSEDYHRVRIRIERLGARRQDDSVSGVFVLWVAKPPHTDASVIVGWYRNATVYRDWQELPTESHRECSGNPCGYYVEAAAEDAILVPSTRRDFCIPTHGEFEMGASNVWYADDRRVHRQFRISVLKYISSQPE